MLSSWLHVVDTLRASKGSQTESGLSVSDICSNLPDLLSSPLDGAVLAGHVFAVPVVGGAAGQAEVRVAFPHCQVARTLLGVALGLTPTPWKTVLTCECVCWDSGSTGVRVLQV